MSASLSRAQHPDSGYGGVEMAHYQGPESGGIGHRVGHISSFEQHGGAFKTKSFGFGAGLSAQNRSGVVNWEGNSTPPGFQQN